RAGCPRRPTSSMWTASSLASQRAPSGSPATASWGAPRCRGTSGRSRSRCRFPEPAPGPASELLSGRRSEEPGEMEKTVLLSPDGHAAGGCADGGEPPPVHPAAPRRLVLPRRPGRQAADRATCPCQGHVGPRADQQLLRASRSAPSLRQPVRRHARTALGVDVEDPTLILPPI